MNVVSDYTYVQQTPSDTWDINHPLGNYPTVSVVLEIEGATRGFIPKDIEYIDGNNLRIHFSQPRSGTARLV